MLQIWHFMKGYVALFILAFLMTGCSGSSTGPTAAPSPPPIENATTSPDPTTSQEIVIERVVFIQSSAPVPA